jgi:hypothetical protein
MPTYKVRYAHIRASVSGAHSVTQGCERATTHRRRRLGDRSRDLHVIACAESLHYRGSTSTSTSPRRRRDGIHISLPQERRGASGAGGGEDVQISRREPLTTAFRPGHPTAAHGRVSAAAAGTCTMRRGCAHTYNKPITRGLRRSAHSRRQLSHASPAVSGVHHFASTGTVYSNGIPGAAPAKRARAAAASASARV